MRRCAESEYYNNGGNRIMSIEVTRVGDTRIHVVRSEDTDTFKHVTLAQSGDIIILSLSQVREIGKLLSDIAEKDN